MLNMDIQEENHVVNLKTKDISDDETDEWKEIYGNDFVIIE